MAPRPNWKGYLKLSLVSCPIALYPAISAAERVSFRQVNKQTGHRLRHQLVDAVTGEPVGREDQGRGYEVGENQFLLVKDEELETAQQVARTLPFSAAPATSPGTGKGDGPNRRVEPALPAAAAASERAAPAVQPAPALQPPPAPVRAEKTRTDSGAVGQN